MDASHLATREPAERGAPRWGLANCGIECQSGDSYNHLPLEAPEMNVTTYGLDIAKNVMQLHWVEPEAEKSSGASSAAPNWRSSSRSVSRA